MNFKEIFSPFADRAKSPLYASFVASWLIWNWRIVFAIMFFKRVDFKGMNLTDFIYTNYVNTWDTIGIPLISALIYILVLPWIDYIIIWYSEFTKRLKLDKKIEIGRKFSIDGNQYYDLKLEFEKERKVKLDSEIELKKVQGELTTIENELKTSKETNENINSQKNELDRKYNLLNNRNSINDIFSGRWTVTYTMGDSITKEDIDVRGNQYNVVKDNKTNPKYLLKLIDLDVESKRLSFVKFDSLSKTPHSTSELRLITRDKFEGQENDEVLVTYERNQLSIGSFPIEIYSATYGVPSKLVDVTKSLAEQVSRGITQGPVDPSTFGIPDPIYGTVKTLRIHFSINHIEKTLTFKDGETFMIE